MDRSINLDENARPNADADGGFSIVSASLIGEANRRRVLQTLFDRGPTSRADLARLSGTNRTTITGIVQPLLDSGLIVEAKPVQRRNVGKPPRPLWFSEDAPPVCAVKLLPDRVCAAMVSITGVPYARVEKSVGVRKQNRAAYLRTVESCVGESLKRAKSKPLGIGVGCGHGRLGPGHDYFDVPRALSFRVRYQA